MNADLRLPTAAAVEAAARDAIDATPPLWPLATSVAVNPYLGQAASPVAEAAERLARVAGASLTMPRSWYAERIERGEIAEDDLAAALAEAPSGLQGMTPADLAACALEDAPAVAALPTLADLAMAATGTDWPAFVADRITAFAGGYFDEGQALWAVSRERGFYATWREAAIHDLGPEIAGVENFAAFVRDGPSTAHAALVFCARVLGLGAQGLELYFHRLLTDLGGWAQLARRLDWSAAQEGGADETALDRLAVRALWDAALLRQFDAGVTPLWEDAAARYGAPLAPADHRAVDLLLHAAAEHADRRRLFATLCAAPATEAPLRPRLQAAFCIDVRSEPYRRALEAAGAGVETLGFAGFFGLALEHHDDASDVAEARRPVLLPAAAETRADAGAADGPARIEARAKRAWGRFKLAAVSSFAFVEAAGPLYLAGLARDALGRGRTAPDAAAPQFDPPLNDGARIDAAETILRAMSLTERFAPVVLLLGHGAAVANNPHAAGLQCGACGGHAGDANARLLAGLLNDAAVRRGLAARGISIPGDTLFIAGLHDTTTDDVRLFDVDPSAHAETRRLLSLAGAAARARRAHRLPRAKNGDDVFRRARDWAETRPEWGLAGCTAFIAAPRARTAGADLGGRAFLHDYDWTRDADFKVLELILTAPVVVASWINLQYCGSTTAPHVFGSGDKLLHNVVGGGGVLEGGSGPLRGGLAFQSVYDGERFVHAPYRLNVVVAAPRDAIAEILARHEHIRDLFENGWLNLFALDGDDGEIVRHVRGGRWRAVTLVRSTGRAPLSVDAAS